MREDIRITADIDTIPKGSNCAVIIRHGDRNGPQNQVVRSDEALNPEGAKKAEQLGNDLKRFSDIVSYSSAIGRCVDTCIHISNGYGKKVEPVTTDLLGMSSPFMVDPQRAYALMKQVGLLNFVDQYVHDSLDPSIVMPCPEGMEMLLSFVVGKIERMNGGVGVFVTHDMIITPGMAYYLGYDFKNGLVPFLDGFVLYEDGDGYIARYDGKEISVSAKGRPLK